MTAKKIEPIDFIPLVRPNPRFEKVMLIDDNEIDLFINGTILKAMSFSKEIHQENNPQKALRFLSNVEKLSDIPDIIFLDLNMPAMGGFEFLAEFNQLSEFVKNKCKIIVVTASPLKEDKHKALMYPNVIRYFIKPLDIYHLREFIG
jgi:CheY-like chemotaxis protein